MNTVLSERGSLIIYLDKVRHHCFLPLDFISLPCSSFHHLYLPLVHRFLTHDQRRLLLGSIRRWKWDSHNQLLCLSMNTITVSLRDTLTTHDASMCIAANRCHSIFWNLSFPLQKYIVSNSTIQRGQLESYCASVQVMHAHVQKVTRMMSNWPYPLSVNINLLYLKVLNKHLSPTLTWCFIEIKHWSIMWGLSSCIVCKLQQFIIVPQ